MKPEKGQEGFVDRPAASVRGESLEVIQDFFPLHGQFDAVGLRMGDEGVGSGHGIRRRPRVVLNRRGAIAQECRYDLIVPLRRFTTGDLSQAVEVMDRIAFRIDLDQAVRFHPPLDDDARIDDAAALDMDSGHEGHFHGDPNIILDDDGGELCGITHRHGEEGPMGVDGAARPQTGIESQRNVLGAVDQAMDPDEAVVAAGEGRGSLDLAPVAHNGVRSDLQRTDMNVDEIPNIDVVADRHLVGIDEGKGAHFRRSSRSGGRKAGRETASGRTAGRCTGTPPLF